MTTDAHSANPTPPANILARFWIYQNERFPVIGHGILIAAFSFSAVSYSSLLRGQIEWPRLATVVVAFVSAFLFFLQLRLADEFKDFEEDSQFRPYRPVPRGLVTLRELGVLWGLTLVVQLGLAWWLEPRLAPLLLLVWGYLALMSREFFVRDWLKARPITYLLTHMLIVPLIDFYTTACDWLAAGANLPHWGLVWFLVVSFFNGVVIEIGRKIRAPQDEETGVETYSALWGPRRAVLVWWGAVLVTAISAWFAARQIDFAGPVSVLLVMLLVLAAVVAARFWQNPVTSRAKLIETMSGIWTLLMYLGIGAVPLLYRVLWGG
ncbi:MAG: UbiA family prenyltransferase [Anaerolineae bacterium]|nr:UbiA family prenyltransferase [Anaerolineae bacterium]MCB9104564.1 UbiA family prenyltransferase [Anaerolineales bacterium]